MDFDPLYLLRKKRRGVQCERTLRSIYILLSGWYRYSGDRLILAKPKGTAHRPKGADTVLQQKMSAIPFDKLIMLFGRVWDELFAHTGAKLKTRDPATISDNEANEVISFPLPFEELPGKHGPGRAVRRRNGEPRFLVSVIHSLNQEDILSYFDVRPPSNSPNTPNDPRTTIDPALAATADAALLEGYTKEERDVLEDLTKGVRRLGVEEIRALGTHENFAKTAEDIEREFKYMRRHLETIEASVHSGSSFEEAAVEVFECADEACRKSERNREPYDFARESLKNELTNPLLKKAFLDCQRPGAEIWDRAEMKELARRCRVAYKRSEYLREIGRWSAKRYRSTGATKVDIAELSEQLKRTGSVGLPAVRSEIFLQGSCEITPRAKEKILALIDQLRAS